MENFYILFFFMLVSMSSVLFKKLSWEKGKLFFFMSKSKYIHQMSTQRGLQVYGGMQEGPTKGQR